MTKTEFSKQAIVQYLFSTPTSKVKVRNGVHAYKYPNGCININGEKYFSYSIKAAIKHWRLEKRMAFTGLQIAWQRELRIRLIY